MSKTLIVDDEKHCMERIVGLLSKCEPKFESINYAKSVEDAIYKTNQFHPDLIFLDIQLGNQTGFDFLSSVDHEQFDIIFTTAYDQYAIEAFKFCALDYLLKPISVGDFKSALNRYNNKISKNYFDERIKHLIQNLKTDFLKRKIAVCSSKGYEFLDLKNIIRFEADGNYTHIFTKDTTKFTVAKTLKVFDDLLKGCNFYRVHHSHLINLHHVKRYFKGKGGYIVMEDNSSVSVSFRKREGFLKAITAYY
jgi:two-component system LytT family response regulator